MTCYSNRMMTHGSIEKWKLKTKMMMKMITKKKSKNEKTASCTSFVQANLKLSSNQKLIRLI